MARQVEEIMLGAPQQYTRGQLHELADIDAETDQQLWRSMGFANVGDRDVVFTDNDLQAVRRLKQLGATGLVSDDLRHAVLRSMAQAMSGLAEWQIEMFYRVLANRPGQDRRWMADLQRLLPELESLQDYVWRRHLAVATARLITSAPDEADIQTLAVGSTDLVGFTRTARRLDSTQLLELVERFNGIATEVIADGRGRIVKTVGDAVLFVTDEPEGAARIALDMLERTAEEATLPELRTGLALGPVLTRFGDIYGGVVDNASRLCTHARPGRILVERELAGALEPDRRFTLRMRRPISERGYPRLHSWELREA